jgi:hypothetical protein
MGPITSLLLFPVAGPAWALMSLMERLREEAEASLDDEARGFAELTELTMCRSAGMLSETEYAEQETALLARLNAAREYREQLQSVIDEEEAQAQAEAEAEVGAEEDMEEIEC